MSNFNPQQNKLSASEWQEIASEQIEETGAQFLVIGGILAGLTIAAATAFPPSGVLVASWCFYSAYKKTVGANRNESAIAEYGCVAQCLKGDKLADFREQVGDDETYKQIKWASERGNALTGDAQDFLDTYNPKLSTPVLQQVQNIASGVTDAVRRVLPPATTTTAIMDKQPNDLIGAMSDRVRNHLIIGAQGSGKGLVVSNALDSIKSKHPDVTVFYIDPKGDDKETGYFDGRIDVLKRIKSLEKKHSAIVEWFKDAVKCYQALEGKKLLILDEATYLSTIMKNEGEGNWFKSVIMGLVSVGDSQGWNIWIIALNPNTDDIGVSGGVRSQFMPLSIVSLTSLATYTALISTKWLPADKKISSEDIQDLCNESPVNRCYYYGGINKWLPLPKLSNFSGYDRDAREYLPGREPGIIKDAANINEAPTVIQGQSDGDNLSIHAQLILEWLREKRPDTWVKFRGKEGRDMSFINFLSDKGLKGDERDDALEELISAGKIEFNVGANELRILR